MLKTVVLSIGCACCIVGSFVVLVILWDYAIELFFRVWEYKHRMMVARKCFEVVFRYRTEDGRIVEYLPSKKKIKQVEEEANGRR